MSMIKTIYQNYFKRFKSFRSLAVTWKRVRYFKSVDTASPTWSYMQSSKVSIRDVRMAVICDDMTWMTLQGICDLVYLTPDHWREMLDEHKPDMFFCESAWQGTTACNHCWEDQIPRRQNIWGDNRFVLKDILAYCRKVGIPTVFWNKEDPYSDSENYNFTDTAVLFDHICTTAKECIPRYQEKGHSSVHLLPFGYSDRLFYPLEEPGEENTAVFFGSWYQQFPERCADTEQMFEFVLSQGMKLVIYDRHSALNEPGRIFPERYRPYVRDAVAYTEIRNEMAKYRHVLNLNTEKQSETMFARRVFEIMACGRLIISNDSVGLRKLFPNSIWYLGEPFDLENADLYIRRNQEFVCRECTMEHQLLRVMREIGFVLN